MSGIKETTVTMTSTQRDSMLRQCREAQDEAARQSERAAQLERANSNAQSRITALNGKINNQIVGLSNEMREIERKQNAAFRSALEKQGADIRRDMKQQKEELTQMVGNIEQQINAKEHNHQQLAEIWASDARAYLTEIENYRHEMFTPNRLQMLRTKLEQMQSSMNAQAYQAAISIASEVLNSAVVLRSDVVEAELEWVEYFERLSRDVAELSSAINAAKLLEFQIGEDKVQARVDYWSNGALTELTERITEIQQILRDPNNTDSNTLVSLIKDVDNMMQQLSAPNIGLIDSAKEALMLSACREDMANDVVNALTGMGWELEDYTYRNNEQKEALHAKIVDRTGNECVVIIEPHNNQGKLENKLLLDFFNDNEADTSSTETYISSIKQELQNNGIKLDLRCVEGYENQFSDRNEIRNIEQARGQGTVSR